MGMMGAPVRWPDGAGPGTRGEAELPVAVEHT